MNYTDNIPESQLPDKDVFDKDIDSSDATKSILEQLQSEILGANLDEMDRLKLKEKILDASMIFANHINSKESNINIDDLRKALGELFNIERLHTFVLHEDSIGTLEGDWISDEDLLLIENIRQDLNPDDFFLSSENKHYMLLGNNLLVIQGEKKVDDDLMEYVIRIFRSTLCYAMKDIENKKYN